MADKRVIQAVAGDRGGWNAIGPVLIKAAGEELVVEVQLVGATLKQVQEGQLKLDDRFKLVEKLQSSPRTVTVLGMSQSQEGLAAILDAVIAAEGPVVGIQDYYGSALPLLKALQQVNKLDALSVLCVDDAIAQRHLAKNGFDLLTIRVTGNPHFDQTVKTKQNWLAKRQELRQLLHISDQDFLFLVVGQPNGTAEILGILEAGLAQVSLSQPEHILVRMHPRATPENQKAMTEYYTTTSYKNFVSVSPEVKLSSDDVLPVADFVLSGYSTTNHLGVLYEMPGVMYIRTVSLQRDLTNDTGLDQPLEVQAGAAWYITEPNQLVQAVTQVLSAEPSSELQKIKGNQHQIAQYTDGHATERCWLELQKVLN